MSIYGTLADANTYHAERGNAAWAAGTDPDKEAALVRATDYIDSRYRYQMPSGRWQSMFPGEKTNGRSQDREWPRTGAVDYDCNPIPDDEVPVEVENATYEAAIRELASPGSLTPDFIPGQQVTREKVDVIEVQYAEAQTTANQTPNRPIIPAIDEIIAPVTFRPYAYPGVVVV